MINTSPENIIQVQKNEQEAEKIAKPKETEKPKESKENPQTYDSEALSAALSGNTGTAVNAMGDEKVKSQSQTPNQPIYDSEALSAALSGNTGTAVNASETVKPKETEKPKDMVTEEQNILNQLSGRPNESVPIQGLNPDKNLTMDKAPSQAAPNPSDTFVATPEMFKEPKTDDKPVITPEAKSPEQKSDKAPKKKLTKEQKIARKLFRKSGRGKYSSSGTKGSPTIVRTLDPNLQAAAKGGRQSA